MTDDSAPEDDAAMSDARSEHVEGSVHIDCDSCAVRPSACGDCVVAVLLGPPPALLVPEEQRALDVLAEAGLVPPLRLVSSRPPPGESGRGRAAGGNPCPSASAAG